MTSQPHEPQGLGVSQGNARSQPRVPSAVDLPAPLGPASPAGGRNEPGEFGLSEGETLEGAADAQCECISCNQCLGYLFKGNHLVTCQVM